MTVQYFSVAKINLFLRVLGRRSDGYHELASLFQAVSLSDELQFKEAKKDRVICPTHPHLPEDERNLIVRAIRLFRQLIDIPPIEVLLHKTIPMGAGLGGGSSNAATTLFALNEMVGCPLDRRQLLEMGSRLGSDVAFFFSGGRALCKGRGEIVDELSLPAPSFPLWLIIPPWPLSTRDVFSRLNVSRCSQQNPIELLEAHQRGQWAVVNDLEIPAFEIEPRLISLKNDLMKQGFHTVFMTGSGSGLVAVGEGPPLLEKIHICHLLNFVQLSRRYSR